MDANWVKVYASGSRELCHSLSVVLESCDIPVIALDKKDSFYLFGEVELWVPREFSIPALQRINESLS